MNQQISDPSKSIFFQNIFQESLDIKSRFIASNCNELVRISELVTDALRQGKKILLFGNGGSAADAQHLAAEFVNRLLITRPAVPALALTTDTSILTSVANDFSFDEIFARQVEAFGQDGDIAMAISTSGKSGNLVRAIESAKTRKMITIGLLGGDGGQLQSMVDYHLTVSSTSSQRVQETHITIGHALCEWVEKALFSDS